MIGAVAVEGALVRFAELVTGTVQVYAMPLVNPETITSDEVLEPEFVGAITTGGSVKTTESMR